MKVERKLWTRDELILSLNLYLKLPFGKLHSRTPAIIHLATILGRTPGSIAMRLNNFASVDPYHQQRGIGGLSGGKKQVEPIWNEFINNKEELLFESERILAGKEKTVIEDKFAEILKGTERLKGEYKGLYSLSVTGDIRALYKRDGEAVIIFAFIGTHSQLYK